MSSGTSLHIQVIEFTENYDEMWHQASGLTHFSTPPWTVHREGGPFVVPVDLYNNNNNNNNNNNFRSTHQQRCTGIYSNYYITRLIILQ